VRAAVERRVESQRAPKADPAEGARRTVISWRLGYLDGLRAAASVYVVLFHAVIGFPRGELAGPWRLLRRTFSFGHEAVAIFIVLSGYCLMLPVVRSGKDKVLGGFGRFIGRRAFRILPPYYASVVASLLLIASVDVLARPGSGTIWDDSLPGLELGPIAGHVFLVHNWVRAWAFQINGPLWSVASEWQIYFFFPLLLLPVWRRFGALVCVLVALAVGYAPLLFVPVEAKIAIPWYLALFALGMIAAAIVHVPRAFEQTLRARAPWGRLSLALIASAVIGGWFFGPLWFKAKPLTDLWLGLATAVLLVQMALEVEAGAPSRLTRWLSSNPAVAVGHMSYSLYLTHLPVLALCHFALDGLALSPGVHGLALLAVGAPLSLLVGWLFFLAVERPCMALLAKRR
jgi:peptidoglycan/LPS O-acetylase OafA/YrhL